MSTEPRKLDTTDGRSRGDDAGAVLIETALVLPIMMIIFFGLTQLAFAMSSGSSAIGASRTGARAAASTFAPAAWSGNATNLADTLDNIRLGVERDLVNRPTQSTPVSLSLYRADVNGDPVGGAGCTTDCIEWLWSGTGFAAPTGTWIAPDACGTTVDNVGVRVVLDHDVTAPFLGDVSIDEATTMRLEPITNTAC